MEEKSFKFCRGEEYSVVVTLTRGQSLVFTNINVPHNTDQDVTLQLLEDAERAVISKLEDDNDFSKQ